MSATLRYRGDKKHNLIELAKTLDAFKKVPEKYTETTEIGGTLSLLSRLFIIYLIYTELRYYWHDANIVYQFEPDIDMDEQVQMHVDITVAMPCSSLSGVDLMDETQQDVFAYGTLQREGTWWNMPPEERAHFELIQMSNQYLREQYHSIADILFKDIIHSTAQQHNEQTSNTAATRPRSQQLNEEKFDACRLHGTLGINKVAGVLHLVGGAQPVVGLFEDHWMIELRRLPANFTHRINRLSFGQYSRRIVQPLEGDETVLSDEATTVQYFLKIVPTEIHNTFSTINTFQYAVTENVRHLDSERNSYGSPGIYFKYDWSALKIVVRNDRDSLPTFLIRLCSVIAGIIVISGILNALIVGFARRVLRSFAPQVYYQMQQQQQHQQQAPQSTVPVVSALPTTSTLSTLSVTSVLPPVATGVFLTNNLISTANQMADAHFNANTKLLHAASAIPHDSSSKPL